jgi:hypothetical protein
MVMAVGIGAFALFAPWMSENRGLLMAVNYYEEVAADHVNCSGYPVPSSLDLPLESVQARVEQILGQISSRFRLTENESSGLETPMSPTTSFGVKMPVSPWSWKRE